MTLELARKGVKVVVLEAQEAGFGGSGRNQGSELRLTAVLKLPEA